MELAPDAASTTPFTAGLPAGSSGGGSISAGMDALLSSLGRESVPARPATIRLEPSRDTFNTLFGLGDIAAFCLIPEECRLAIYNLLETSADAQPIVVAQMDAAGFRSALIELAYTREGSTEPRPPGPIVKSSLTRSHTVCRWATGEMTQTEASAKDLSDQAFVEAAIWPAATNNDTQSTIAAADSRAPVQKVKLSVLDAHNLSGEVPILGEESVLAC